MFLLMLTLARAVPAADDMQAATLVWNDFTASLRRGDYARAHRLFSRESRTALPYAEFVAEYGPLSAAREMVLAKVEGQSTRLDGEWAEIALEGLNPGTGRRFRIGVSLVSNQGAWGLVAARNERNERLEAEARGVLRAASIWLGRPDAGELLAALQRENAESLLLRHYRFERDGDSFRATPLVPGLRAFYVGRDGVAKPVGAAESRPAWGIEIDEAAVPAAMPPPPAAASGHAPAAPVGVGGGLPELTEPPPLPKPLEIPRTFFEDMPEPAEPPMPGNEPSASARVDLPDSIE